MSTLSTLLYPQIKYRWIIMNCHLTSTGPNIKTIHYYQLSEVLTENNLQAFIQDEIDAIIKIS
jgi:hypothetical protein